MFSFCRFRPSRTINLTRSGPKGIPSMPSIKTAIKWASGVHRVEELRGNPGYEEEGCTGRGRKTGSGAVTACRAISWRWRIINWAAKTGIQQYFSELGDLIEEQSWKGYNPDAPLIPSPSMARAAMRSSITRYSRRNHIALGWRLEVLRAGNGPLVENGKMGKECAGQSC